MYSLRFAIVCLLISTTIYGMHIPIKNASTLIEFNDQTKTILSWINQCLWTSNSTYLEPFGATRLVVKMDNDLLDIGTIGELKNNQKALEHVYNGNALYCAHYMQATTKNSDGEYNHIPALIIGTNNPDNCILLRHLIVIRQLQKAKL